MLPLGIFETNSDLQCHLRPFWPLANPTEEKDSNGLAIDPNKSTFFHLFPNR